MKRNRWILPCIAAVLALAAVLIYFLQPNEEPATQAAVQTAGTGNIVIEASDLSADKISFFRIGGDSKIELLARIGDDGEIKAVLGTCQSCNGSPGAYYTQQGNTLRCNNCGLTFPLSVIDAPGGGCHPIMIDPSLITRSDGCIEIDRTGLSVYESLFEKVAPH